MMTVLMHEGQFSQEPQKKLHLSRRLPKQLTLEHISPKWASRLSNENIPTFMSLTWLQWRFELQRSSKCVVGEAYGYSSGYTESCGDCDRIGCKFLYYFTLNWRRKLEQNKREFVKHWNEVHNHKNARFGSFQG